MLGHIKTNKSCPLFGTDDDGEDIEVKKSGEGKIKIKIKHDSLKKPEPNDINTILDNIYKKMLKVHAHYCEPFLKSNDKYHNDIDLSTISEKISNWSYTSTDEFLDDLDEIKNYCIEINEPDFINNIGELIDFVQNELQKDMVGSPPNNKKRTKKINSDPRKN